MSVDVVPMTAAHADAVLAIYQAGIDTGDATFETQAPDWATWTATHLAEHRFVARDATVAGAVSGWAALSPVSDRCAYAGVVEDSVYVAANAAGRGVGTALLRALVASTEAAGIWTIQAGVFPENAASLRLHERCGFRTIGVREKLGRRDGIWRDVILLERRSGVVGI